jgi:hypothetical protein
MLQIRQIWLSDSQLSRSGRPWVAGEWGDGGDFVELPRWLFAALSLELQRAGRGFGAATPDDDISYELIGCQSKRPAYYVT